MGVLNLVDQLTAMPEARLIITKALTVLDNEEKDRKEFYDTVNEDIKAEFINGQMIVHSPVTFRHNMVSSKLFKIIDTFVDINDLGFTGIEKIMISLTRNDYEPDICFFRKEKAKNFSPDQKLFPAPDFVVEIISESTEKYNRGVKFIDYAAHGIEEYWIVDPEKEVAEQYKLVDEAYTEVKKSDDGRLHCIVLEGLDLPVRAIFDKEQNQKFIRELM